MVNPNSALKNVDDQTSVHWRLDVWLSFLLSTACAACSATYMLWHGFGVRISIAASVAIVVCVVYIKVVSRIRPPVDAAQVYALSLVLFTISVYFCVNANVRYERNKKMKEGVDWLIRQNERSGEERNAIQRR